MALSINMKTGVSVNGGPGVGLMTSAGNPWSVADALALELVNRGVATPVNWTDDDVVPLSVSELAKVRALVSGAGSSATAIAFATSIPLTGNGVMPQQTVGSVLAFTPAASPALFGQCYVRLLADGTNAPTFVGFTEHGSSAGYLNTSGILNMVQFWYDGSVYWYSVSQSVNPTPVTVPSLVSAIVPSGAAGTLVLTYSQTMDATSVPAVGQFTIANSGGADTVTGVAISGTTVTLTKSRATLAGDTLTVSYAVPGSNALRSSSSGTPAAALTTQAVENLLANVFIRMGTIANLTEAAVGGGGFKYTSTGTFSTAVGSVPSASLPASADGWLEFVMDTVSGGVTIAMASLVSATHAISSTNAAVLIYADSTNYKCIRNGTNTGAANAPAAWMPTAGDIIRLRRASGVWVAEGSRDNRATWTLLNTYTGAENSQVYPQIAAQAPSVIGPIRGFGVT